MDQQSVTLQASNNFNIMEYLLFGALIIFVLLLIYYVYHIGNKHVEEGKRLRFGPSQIKLLFFLGVVTLGIVLLVSIFPLIRGLIAPFIIAAVLAYAFNPLLNKLKAWGLRRVWATALIFIMTLVILIAFFMLLVPVVIEEGSQLLAELPALGTNLYNNLDSWYQERIAPFDAAPDNFSEIFNRVGVNTESITEWFTLAVTDIFNRIGGILSSLINVVTVPVLMFYFMKDGEDISQFFKRMIFPRYRPYVFPLMRDIEGVLGSFIRGRLLVSVAVALLSSLGLLLIGVPYWMIFGIIAGLTDLIPYVGPFIGAVPPLIFMLATDPVKALWVAVVFFIVQQLESNVVSPKIVGESVGLHPAMVIFVLLLGGALWGLIGLLISVPIAGMIIVIVKYVLQWFKRNYPHWFNRRHV